MRLKWILGTFLITATMLQAGAGVSLAGQRERSATTNKCQQAISDEILLRDPQAHVEQMDCRFAPPTDKKPYERFICDIDAGMDDIQLVGEMRATCDDEPVICVKNSTCE